MADIIGLRGAKRKPGAAGFFIRPVVASQAADILEARVAALPLIVACFL